MRADLTLPGLTLLPQLGKALQFLGWGHPVPIKKKDAPPVSAPRDKPGEPLFREGPPWQRYDNKGNNIVALACHQ